MFESTGQSLVGISIDIEEIEAKFTKVKGSGKAKKYTAMLHTLLSDLLYEVGLPLPMLMTKSLGDRLENIAKATHTGRGFYMLVAGAVFHGLSEKTIVLKYGFTINTFKGLLF